MTNTQSNMDHLRLKSVGFAAGVFGAIATAILLHLVLGSHRLRGFGPGGVIGEYGAELMVSLVGRVGAALFGVVGLAVSLVLTTQVSMRTFGAVALAGLRAAWRGLLRGASVMFPERGENGISRPEPKKLKAPKQQDDTHAERVMEVDDTDEVDTDEERADHTKPGLGPIIKPEIKKPAKKKRDDEAQVVKLSAEDAGARAGHRQREDRALRVSARAGAGRARGCGTQNRRAQGQGAAFGAASAGGHLHSGGRRLSPAVARAARLSGDRRVRRRSPEQGRDARARREAAAHARRLRRQGRRRRDPPRPGRHDVRVRAGAGHRCPRSPTSPTTSRMALEALRVRIVAPIPGKAAVGIEVPEQDARDGLPQGDPRRRRVPQGQAQAAAWRSARTSRAAPVVVDLAKMPHLLVAGTTGSGKSVAVNAMIIEPALSTARPRTSA